MLKFIHIFIYFFLFIYIERCNGMNQIKIIGKISDKYLILSKDISFKGNLYIKNKKIYKKYKKIISLYILKKNITEYLKNNYFRRDEYNNKINGIIIELIQYNRINFSILKKYIKKEGLNLNTYRYMLREKILKNKIKEMRKNIYIFNKNKQCLYSLNNISKYFIEMDNIYISNKVIKKRLNKYLLNIKNIYSYYIFIEKIKLLNDIFNINMEEIKKVQLNINIGNLLLSDKLSFFIFKNKHINISAIFINKYYLFKKTKIKLSLDKDNYKKYKYMKNTKHKYIYLSKELIGL